MSYLHVDNNLLMLQDEHGRPILEACSANVQLSNGVSFPLHALERQVKTTKTGVVVSAGGNAVLPKLVWRAILLASGQVQIKLEVTNTTPNALPIERLDVLYDPHGYCGIAGNALTVRRTGWQTFSPASLATPLGVIDPWLQPPLYAPTVPPSASQQQSLPWMTVLQSSSEPPLLIGFGGAKEYMGTIEVQASLRGHQIVAANYVEGVMLQPGQTCTSEPLLIMWGAPEETLLGRYGDFVGAYMEARVAERTPTGWSHWLYYFTKVTEQDILGNTQVIAEKDLPFEYIQVDDGYQTAFGDWLSINETFSHGMAFVAERIRAAGRKPGIWLSPFMASGDSQVVNEHPEWFLKDAAGNHINVNRHGDPYWQAPNYGLDITHPEAYAWLEHVLQTMCESWGYEYIKADFLYAGAIRAVRYDASCTSVQAYRKGMALIRRIAGDRLVLGCGAPLLCSVGFVDDMRIGPDLSWEFDSPGANPPLDVTKPTSREPLLSLFSHQWMNRRLWVNDADYIRVRQHHISLNWQQTVALTVLIVLGGGALYNSDNLLKLEAPGYALLDRLYPAAPSNARLVGEANASNSKPQRLLQTTTLGDETWHIAAHFNWGSREVLAALEPKQWDLPEATYHVYDLIRQQYLGMGTDAAVLPLIPAQGVGLYGLCAVSDRPSVIATTGHLLGPAGDIERVTWRDKQLSIHLIRGRRTATQVLISVPRTYTLGTHKNCKVSQSNDITLSVTPQGNHCTLYFITSNSQHPSGVKRDSASQLPES